MNIVRLPFRAGLAEYAAQAEELLRAWRTGAPDAVEFVRHTHPRFLNPDLPWLPRRMSDSDLRSAPFDDADARLSLARWYAFDSWPHLAEHVDAVTRDGSPVARFETAVEAVIDGDVAALSSMLRDDLELVRARSTRVTRFDPPVHRATLLHYLAANGVEGYRQRTPKTAVQIATLLLESGAAVDALADMYGGQYPTMSMLVSSTPPAEAGLQVPLVNTLIDFGAAVNPQGQGEWSSPLMTALAFGFRDAADALVRRGARVESLPAAAALGPLAAARELLPGASAIDRHRALALAAQHGHVEVVRLLLDAGEDPNRYNPKGNHGHSTPLHQAALAGHEAVVRLIVERGARLDIADTIYEGTPLAWAEHGGHTAIAAYLREHGVRSRAR